MNNKIISCFGIFFLCVFIQFSISGADAQHAIDIDGIYALSQSENLDVKLRDEFKDKIAAGTLCWSDITPLIPQFFELNEVSPETEISRAKAKRVIAICRWAISYFKEKSIVNEVDVWAVNSELGKFCAFFGSWDTNIGVSVEDAVSITKDIANQYKESRVNYWNTKCTLNYVRVYLRYLSNTEPKRSDEFHSLLLDVYSRMDEKNNPFGCLEYAEALCDPVWFKNIKNDDVELMSKQYENYDRLVQIVNPSVDIRDGENLIFNEIMVKRATSLGNPYILRWVGERQISYLNNYEKTHPKDINLMRRMFTYSAIGRAIRKNKDYPHWRRESFKHFVLAVESAQPGGFSWIVATNAQEAATLAKLDGDGDIPDNWNMAVKYYDIAINNYPRKEATLSDLYFCYSEKGFSLLSKSRIRDERLPALACYLKALEILESNPTFDDRLDHLSNAKHQLAFCKYVLFDDLESTLESIQLYDESIAIRTELKKSDDLINSLRRRVQAMRKRDVISHKVNSQTIASLKIAYLGLVTFGGKVDEAEILLFETLESYIQFTDQIRTDENMKSAILELLSPYEKIDNSRNSNVQVVNQALLYYYSYSLKGDGNSLKKLKEFAGNVDVDKYPQPIPTIIKKIAATPALSPDKF